MGFGRSSDLMVVLCWVLVILGPTRTQGLCWPECMRVCDDLKIVCGAACVIACMGKSPFYNHYEPELIAVPGPAAAPSPAHRAMLKMRESPGFASTNNGNGDGNGNGNNKNNSKEEEEEETTTTTSSSSLFSQFP